MTRINSAIAVKSLTDEHLLAEHREIKRLPQCLLTSLRRNCPPRIPKRFTLGRGHVSFFYDKMTYTFKRFREIHAECLKRGFNVTDFSENWDKLGGACGNPFYWDDYAPTETERVLLVERITERIRGSKKPCFHYYGEPITKERAVEMLNEL